MSDPLSNLDAAAKAVAADKGASKSAKGFAAAASAAIHALAPPLPPAAQPAGSGVGLTMYAGKLDTCSHTQDGTYEVVNADIQDAMLLGKVSGLGFAYFNTLASDATHVNLADPSAFANQVRALRAEYGFAGIFLDNCSGANPAFKSGQLLAFLKGIQPLRPACLLQLNVAGFGLHGDGRDDNGASQVEIIGTFAGLADYMMCENWQQVSASQWVPPGSLRPQGSSASYQWWQGWQPVIAATHAAGARAVCLTYGFDVGVSNAIYGRASMIVAGAKPGDVFMYANGSSPSGTDPYSPAWTAAPKAPTVNPVPPVSATL